MANKMGPPRATGDSAESTKRTFSMSRSGLYLVAEQDGEERRSRVSDPFQVVGNVSDPNGSSYGIMLRWRDDRGRQKQQLVPLRLFDGARHEICAQLLDGGLRIEKPNIFLKYIWRHSRTAVKAHLAFTTGWFDPARYVLPDEIVGPQLGNEAKVIYAGRSETPHYFHASGTIEEWQEHLSRRCIGNSRLVLAVCCSFAGPLLRLAGGESVGVHLRGPSSIGKSTAGYVGGSVVGGGGPKGFARSWHATMNGLEAVAALHNDAILILDELSQVDPRDAVKSIYMLGNNAGKNRMNADGTQRRTSEWRLAILSSGEVKLGEHAGVRTRGGSEVRLLDIDADAGRGMGLFDDIRGTPAPKAFADELKAAALRFYGTPFREYLRRLCDIDPDIRPEVILSYRDEFIELCGLNHATPEVGRAASHMALLAAAGELATRMGITGWPHGEAITQVKRCFDAWVADRGGQQAAHDEEQALAAVRRYLEQNGSSRFEPVRRGKLPDQSTTPVPVRDRAGFWRRAADGSTEFLFFRETFKSEVCAGFDVNRVLKALAKRDVLRREGKSMTIKTRLPGLGNIRVYCVRGAIIGGDDKDTH